MRYVDTAAEAIEYNNLQTKAGSPLKTLKGSRVGRSKYKVGKFIGNCYYVHRDYMHRCIPSDILEPALRKLKQEFPDFKFNTVKYHYITHSISFQEAPDFDTSREPMVGDYVMIRADGSTCQGHSDYLYHHKWLFVDNDYKGFDVKESWEWSKTWLNQIEEIKGGSNIDHWNAQLAEHSLPVVA